MSGRYTCHAPFVLSRIRMRVSFFPEESNRHSSTPSELSENSEKLVPRPSQVAPRGKGEPADWCDLSLWDGGGVTAAGSGERYPRFSWELPRAGSLTVIPVCRCQQAAQRRVGQAK